MQRQGPWVGLHWAACGYLAGTGRVLAVGVAVAAAACNAVAVRVAVAAIVVVVVVEDAWANFGCGGCYDVCPN